MRQDRLKRMEDSGAHRSQHEASNGSRARDHLANERTYLAWLRTAASVMVFGLAIAKFGDDVKFGSVLAGSILVVVGVAGVVQGTLRYHRVNRQIEADRYVTGSRGRSAVISSVVLVVAVLGALALLVSDR